MIVYYVYTFDCGGNYISCDVCHSVVAVHFVGMLRSALPFSMTTSKNSVTKCTSKAAQWTIAWLPLFLCLSPLHPGSHSPPLPSTPPPPHLPVQLNCNQSTIARDVIRLTVLQIDKTRRQKGKPGPALTEKDLSDFYMIAVCGDQESVLEEGLSVTEMHQRWPNCRLFLHRYSEDSFVTEHGPCTSV